MSERIKVGNYEFLPSKYIEMLFENGAADSISAIALTAPQNAPVTSYLPYYIKSTQTAVIDDNMGIITFPIPDVSGYSKVQLFIDGNPIDIPPENIAVGKDHITVYNEHGDSVTGILLYDLQFVNDYLIDSAKQLGQLGDILISLYGNDSNKLAKKVKLISKLLTRHRKAEAILGIINIILDLPVAPVDGKILRMSDNLEIVYYDAGEYIVIDKGSYSAPLTNHIAAQNGMTVKLGQPLTNLVELQQRFGELKLFIDPSVARLDYSLSSSFEEILGAYRSYSYRGNDFRMPKPLDEKPDSSDFQGAFYLNKYALTRLTSPIGFAFSYRFVQSRISKNVYNLDLDKPYSSVKLSAPILAQKNQYVTSRLTGSVYNPLRQNAYTVGNLQANIQLNAYKFVKARIRYTVGDKTLENKYIQAKLSTQKISHNQAYLSIGLVSTVYNLSRQNAYAISKLQGTVQFNAYKFVRAKIKYTVGDKALENRYISTVLSVPVDVQKPRRYVKSSLSYTVYNKTREQLYVNSKVIADIQFNSYKFIRAYMEYTVQNTDLQNKFVCADIEAPIDASMLLYIYSRVKNYAYNLDRSKAYTRAVIQMSLKNMDAYTFAKMQTDTKATKPKYIYTALIGDVLNGSLSDRFAAVYIREDIADFTAYYTYASIVANSVSRGPDRYVASNITSDITTKYIPFWYEYDEKDNPAALWIRLPDEYVDSNTNSQTFKVGLSEIKAQAVNYNDPKKVFDFFTDFDSLSEISPYAERSRAFTTFGTLTSNVQFPSVSSGYYPLESYDVNFTEEGLDPLVDSSAVMPRRLIINLLSENEAIPKDSSMLVTSDANDVKTGQATVDMNTTLKNGGLINPLKISNIQNTQNVRLLFQSLTAEVSARLYFFFKARAGTNWNFSIVGTSTFSTSTTATGDWQKISLSGSFSIPFVLKINNTSLAQTKETIWITAFNLVASPATANFEQAITIAPPSIVPLATNFNETFAGKLTKTIPTMDSGTILIRPNPGAFSYNAYGAMFQLLDSTNTRGFSIYPSNSKIVLNTISSPTSSTSIYNMYGATWLYDSLLNTTKVELYNGPNKSTTTVSGKVDFLDGLVNVYVSSTVYSDTFYAFPVAEVYVFDYYIPESTISLMRGNKISDTGEKPIYENSILYTQSKGYLALPLGFNAADGVIGVARVYNNFPNVTYERLFWPGFASKMPKAGNSTGESYIYPASKKTLIAYGGAPASSSYSFDLAYFNSLYSLPAKKWVNSYFEFMPTNSEESNYSYKAFWWNPELLQSIKAWDITTNSSEVTQFVINEDLSDGTMEGTAKIKKESITLEQFFTISSFTQVPSGPEWNYNNIDNASIVNNALRLTPRSDSYLSDTYPKGLELSFPIYDQDFVFETTIAIAYVTGYARAGIVFIDDLNREIGFVGFNDTSTADYAAKYASIKNQTGSVAYNDYTPARIRVERVNGYVNVYIDGKTALSNIYCPDNITKIIFVNSRGTGGWPMITYMDVQNLAIYPGIASHTTQFTRVSPEYTLPFTTPLSSSKISWQKETSSDIATIEVYTNVFDGTNWLGWKQCTNGGQIPDLDSENIDWQNAKIQTKQIMNLPETTISTFHYLTMSNVVLSFNTAEPAQINAFVKPLNKVFIGWPEDYTQVYTDYIGVAKADPISLSYKLNNDCVYVKIDGKLTKQRAIRIPYQYIRTLDKRNALVGFCKPEEWEAAT